MIRSYIKTIELAKNMSVEDIINNFNLLEEGVRAYFSRLCAEHNATQNNPYKLDIDIQGTFGLSENEKIKYLYVYEHESDGIVYFIVGNINDTNPEHIEIDDITIPDKLYIIQEYESIKNQYMD